MTDQQIREEILKEFLRVAKLIGRKSDGKMW